MPQVHGKWKLIKSVGDDMTGKNINPWEFSDDELTTYAENNIFAEIEIVYFKVGENYFVDCMAGDPDEGKMNPYWAFLNRPITEEFKRFQRMLRRRKKGVIEKTERYNEIRHDERMTEEEKEAIREELFEGDHCWPHL